MGFSYAVDMINRMKQERSRIVQNKKRSKYLNDTIHLNNRYPKKVQSKEITKQELELIKHQIRKNLKFDQNKSIFIYIISFLVSLVVIYYFIKFLSS